MPKYEKTRAKANFGSLLKMKDQTFRHPEEEPERIPT
jgi:hypothetical protein